MANEKNKGKRKKMAKSGTFPLPLGQLAFAHVMKPSEGEYSKGYEVTLLIKKSDEASVKEFKQKNLALAREQWGKEIKYKDLEVQLKDGDALADEKDEKARSEKRDKDVGKYNNFRGHYFIRAHSKNKPGMVGPDLKPLPDGEDIQSGDFGRPSVVLSTYERTVDVIEDGKKKKVNVKGITVYLQNIQKQGTGKRFKGDPSNDFTEVEPLELDEGEEGEEKEDVDEDEEFGDDDDDDALGDEQPM